jgi:flagellar biosynthesis protein FlhB
MADQAQRTEKATPRRLEKARREGRFAVSREFVSAIQFATFVCCIGWTAPNWVHAWRNLAQSALSNAWRTEVTAASITRLCRDAVFASFAPLLLPACLVFVVTVLAQLGTTRFGMALSRLAPDLARLNGFSRLTELSKQALPTLGQTLAVMVVLGLAVRSIVADHLGALFQLPFATVDTVARTAGAAVMSLLWKGVGVFLILGLIDLMRQKRRFGRQMRMSKQEIREEMKESEGNPQIKQRIRRIQRDLARRHMLRDVPTATAVIVNPTHYSVALRYALDGPGAPLVVAKGKNYMARRIREIALEHDVPIVENQPLAQALYKSAEVGQEIPAQLYRAVAEILAYIYRLMKGRLPGS